MKKVLIIEDDYDIQKIYSELLKKKRIEVISAKDSKQGLALAKTQNPNLILLDIMLPGGLNGFDVLEKIKLIDGLTNVPVVVLTNLDSEKQIALSMGVSDYLVKANTKPSQVVEKVMEYL